MFEKFPDEPNGLTRRSIPEARYEFLRCQLGRYIYETRDIGGGHRVSMPLFHLIGYGSTWQDAELMSEGWFGLNGLSALGRSGSAFFTPLSAGAN